MASVWYVTLRQAQDDFIEVQTKRLKHSEVVFPAQAGIQSFNMSAN